MYIGFPHSSVGKDSACNAGDPSSIPGLGSSPEEGIVYPLQYSWASLVARAGKESADNLGDLSLIPGSESSLGEGIVYPLQYSWDSLVAQLIKNPLVMRGPGLDPCVERIPWRRAWQPSPVFLPGKSPWTERSLAGYSLWGHKESDTTERLSTEHPGRPAR